MRYASPEKPRQDNLLVEDVRYTQQWESRIQPQLEYYREYCVAQEFVILDHRRTSDSDQRNLDELQYGEVHSG